MYDSWANWWWIWQSDREFVYIMQSMTIVLLKDDNTWCSHRKLLKLWQKVSHSYSHTKPIVQDYHRYLGVLIQQGENRLSRGLNTIKLLTEFMSNNSGVDIIFFAISFCWNLTGNLFEILNLTKDIIDYFQHIKKIFPSLNFISPFWVSDNDFWADQDCLDLLGKLCFIQIVCLSHVSHAMGILNSSVNFIIYR